MNVGGRRDVVLTRSSSRREASTPDNDNLQFVTEACCVFSARKPEPPVNRGITRPSRAVCWREIAVGLSCAEFSQDELIYRVISKG